MRNEQREQIEAETAAEEAMLRRFLQPGFLFASQDASPQPIAIHLHLPEMTVGELKELIRDVVKEMREEEYQRARRPGGNYGGLRTRVSRNNDYRGFVDGTYPPPIPE